MSDPRRTSTASVVPAVVAVGAVILACLFTPLQETSGRSAAAPVTGTGSGTGTTDGGVPEGVVTGSGTTTTDVAAGPTAGQAGVPLAGSGGSAPVATGATGAGQKGAVTSGKGAAKPTKAVTGAAAGAAKKDTPNSYQGVTDKTVLWGISGATNGCGGFNQQATQQAYGLSSNDPLSYQVAMEYFNAHPLEGFPLPPEIRAHVNAKNGFWGRKITEIFRDSGGYACQDVGRANAVTMAEQDKVFGLIMPNTDGPEVPMSLVMAQHKLIHIGRWLTGPLFWSERSPYFYDGYWGDSYEENVALGSWVCRDWRGKKATDTGDLKVTGMPRKFGILVPDVPDFTEGAGFLTKELARCDVNAKVYAIPFELQTLEAQVQTAVNRMITDGVTTILSVNDFLTRLLSSTAATNQGWHPEWVNSGWGIGSDPSAYQTFMEPTQAANAWAAADNASIAFPAWDKREAYIAWKAVRPDQEPPGNWPTFYAQFKLLAIGLAGAGRNLNPATFGQGLQALCNPCPRANALLPFERFNGLPTNREGFTLVKWNPNKDDPIDPPDNQGKPKKGYFDFIENGKRYGLRITDPDAGLGVHR
jgi:hypothetical protein